MSNKVEAAPVYPDLGALETKGEECVLALRSIGIDGRIPVDHVIESLTKLKNLMERIPD